MDLYTVIAPIRDAASVKKYFFNPAQWYIKAKFCLYLLSQLQKIQQSAPIFGNFLDAATIQERPLLARVRYM